MKPILKSIALMLAVFLAGCGGDDKSLFTSQAAAGPDASQADGAVEGRAVKGVLDGALVTAERLVDGEFQWVAQTLTDSNGMYAFDALPAGIIRVTVTPAADGSTRMLCDAAGGCGAHVDPADDSNENTVVDFGEWGPVPEEFSMASITVVEPDVAQTLSVSPLTHLAAAWAQAFPGTINEDVVALAFRRIAAVFLVPEGFEHTHIPALSDSGMTQAQYQQALVNALFAGADGGTPGSSLAGFADSFVGLGGQMPLPGEGYSMQTLMADLPLLGALLDEGGVSALEGYMASLFGTWGKVAVTTAGGAVVTDQEAFDGAVAVLDELDHYLGLAGIDESGTFLATQSAQIDWVFNDDMFNFIKVAVVAAVPVLVATIRGDALAASDTDNDGVLDLSGMLPGGPLVVTYYYQTSPQTITVTGVSNGQLIDMTVELEPIGSGQVLDYALDATLVNSTAAGTLNGTLGLNLYNTDLASLFEAETAEQIAAVLATLRIRAEIAGSGSLVNVSDERTISGDLHAWGEINVPAFGAGAGTFLEAELISGSLCSPNMDCIYTLDGQSGVHVLMDTDAAAEFAFGFEAFGMPAMEMTGSGSLSGAAGLAQDVYDSLSGASALDTELVVALTGILAEAIGNTQGNALLRVPADGKQWHFTLDGGRVDVSATNDTRVALSVFLTSVAGGYLFSGDQLVGTFTLDWDNLALTLYLADGSRRTYALGPITDLVPQEVIDKLLAVLGSIAPA